MKRLLLPIIIVGVLTLLSCEGFIFSSSLEGKWVRETQEITEYFIFEKDNVEYFVYQDDVLITEFKSTFSIFQEKSNGLMYNILKIESESLNLVPTYKIKISNEKILQLEGTTIDTYYKEVQEEIQEEVPEEVPEEGTP